MIAVSSFVTAFLYFQISIRLYLSKVGTYYSSSVIAGTISIITFLLLVAGTVFTIIGIHKDNLCMKSLLFFALLFTIILSLAMILANYKLSFGNVFEFNIASSSKPVNLIAAVDGIAALKFC